MSSRSNPVVYRLLTTAMCAALCTGGLVACTASGNVDGKPLPQLNFASMAPVWVSAANVSVVDNYAPSADGLDVSSSLPTPPDIAVRRYVESRLQPAGGVGTLNFVIEGSTVRKQPVGADTSIERWTGTGTSTRYDAEMRLRFFKQSDTASRVISHTMNVNRSITIPDSYSLAQRDAELQGFVTELVQEMDKAVVDALRDENLIVGAPAGRAQAQMPAMPAPEVSAEPMPISPYQYGQ